MQFGFIIRTKFMAHAIYDSKMYYAENLVEIKEVEAWLERSG